MILVLFSLLQSFLTHFCVLPLLGVIVGYLIERLSLCGLRRSSGVVFGDRTIENLQPVWNALVKTTASVSIVHAVIFFNRVSTSNYTVMYSSTEKMGIPVQFIVRWLCFSAGLGLGSALQPVGLTGGIACGKSTVSKIMSEDPRFLIIDVDQIAHDIVDSTKVTIYGKDSAYYDIIRVFGSDILLKDDTVGTGEKKIPQQQQVDRKKLGDLIFRNPDKRRLLNQLTHPRIIRCMFKRIILHHFTKPHGSVVLVDIPLLFEAGWWMKLLFGCIIVVATLPPSLQLKRLQSRNPDLTTEQCQHRMDSQYPVESKVSKADLVVWNTDITMDELRREVSRIRHEILSLYSNWSRPLGCVLCTWVYICLSFTLHSVLNRPTDHLPNRPIQ